MTTYFIYSITNNANGFTYIGISIDYHKRLRAHRWKLINGSHPAKEMQADFNLYGIESFEFKMLRMVRHKTPQEAKFEESEEICMYDKSYNKRIITPEVVVLRPNRTPVKLATSNPKDYFVYWRDVDGRLLKKRGRINHISDLKERETAGMALVLKYEKELKSPTKTKELYF